MNGIEFARRFHYIEVMKCIFFAYLDPGSGSMIIQMIIGAVAASFFAIKTYWNKILDFFTGKRGQDKK